LGGKHENLTSQLCWLNFLAFHMDFNCWKVTSMIGMHLWMVNWWC
jgi:hypothetical protein